MLDPVVQGAWGSKPGEFGFRPGDESIQSGPCGFAVTDNGWIYVLDEHNLRFQVFDASGRLMKLCPFKGPALLNVFCVTPNGSILASQGYRHIAKSTGCTLLDMPSGDMQSTSIVRMAADECGSVYLEESGGSEPMLIRRYTNTGAWMRYERTFFGASLVLVPFSCEIALVKDIKRSTDETVLIVERITADAAARSFRLAVPRDEESRGSHPAEGGQTRLIGVLPDGRLYVLDQAWFPKGRRHSVRILRYSRTGELEDVLVLKDLRWQYCDLGPDRVHVGPFGAMYVAEADENGYRISKVR